MKWFRLYSEILNDPKVQALDGRLFKTWINFLCIASDNDGRLPEGSHVIARMRLDHFYKARKALIKVGLIEVLDDSYVMHNWDARQWKTDTNAERQRRFRERRRNVTVTPPEAETDTENRVTEAEAEAEAAAAAFTAYENCIGSLNTHCAQRLDEDVAEFGQTCVVHSLQEAAENGARNLRYAEAIMRRHQAEGCYSGAEAEQEQETWQPKPISAEAEAVMAAEHEQFMDEMAKEYPAILGSLSDTTTREPKQVSRVSAAGQSTKPGR